MTSSDQIERAAAQTQPDQTIARICELLDKMAAAESLGGAASVAGVSEDQARAVLKHAAEIIRRTPRELPPRPVRGSLLSWREMTVADALQILSDQAISGSAPLDKT
jgi:hypothetical protein